MESEVTCKHCGSDAVMKYGIYKGVQRYYCKVCKRKFKATDTLFGMKTPTNQISTALNAYYEGMPIKAIRRHLLQEHGNAPSTATIYEWIQRYSQYCLDSVKDYHPNVDDTWIADETVIEIDGRNVWLWDIIDDKTRYLLATRVSRGRTTQDAQILIDRAVRVAGKHPKLVLTDKLASYLDVFYGKGAEHRQGSPFSRENSTSKIERLHGSLKQRTKVMRGLKNLESAVDFTRCWAVHYNYLRPHESLDDRTPAEVGGVEYPYQNWADIIRKHKPSPPVIIEHQPRGRVKLPAVQIGRPRGRITEPKTFPITPRPKKITER